MSLSGPTLAIIVAAGRGLRAGAGIPKQFRPLAGSGKSPLALALQTFLAHEQIDYVCVVIHPDDMARYQEISPQSKKLLPPVFGGATRQESVFNGLKAQEKLQPQIVLVHDAARPFVSADLINRGLDALQSYDGAIPALPLVDTIKRVNGQEITRTEDRETLRRVQTPQIFKFPAFYEAHSLSETTSVTDDAAIAEMAGLRLVLFGGEEQNIKLTFAEEFMDNQPTAQLEPRTGFGYDVHKLISGSQTKHIRLCGCDIAFDRVLEGHSDADVGLHALTDALLGALSLGDIGFHFPPSDNAHKNRDSADFIHFAVEQIAQRGAYISNVDITLVCEKPKINPHREAMQLRVASLLGIDIGRVSIKATTTEKLGFTGREEGIAAQAVATIMVPR